ncbi:MAG: hypothetical protein RL038_127, partial [Actinomycetota bacterium]
VLEAAEVGFGASGRNGGWFSALFPADMDKLSKLSNPQAAVAMQHEMFAVVQRIGEELRLNHIEADWHQGGTFTGIRTKVQAARAQTEARWWRDWGFSEADFRLLDRDSAAAKVNMTELLGASFTPHCARVHPLKLVRGLAKAVEALGGNIFEQTTVSRLDAEEVQLASGHRVRAHRAVIRATEAYTSKFPKQKREVAPVYSLMVATEPLPQDVWDEIGLRKYETFADYRHLIIYGQRTADDRIAFGGRGAPYHFNSNIDAKHELHPPTHDAIWRELVEVFPTLRDFKRTHNWGGALGIARDWTASVGRHSAGFFQAGGYVGDGLGTSALAGQTLAELLTERTTVRTALPWVNHQSRKWEPEPLRWLGVNAGLRVMSVADGEERISGKPSLIAKTFNRFVRS